MVKVMSVAGCALGFRAVTTTGHIVKMIKNGLVTNRQGEQLYT